MAYDPNGTVVDNATALSDDIDEAVAASQAVTASLIALRDRITAYQNRPRPKLSLSAPVAKPEGNSGTTLFSFTLTLDRDGSTDEFPYSYVVEGSGPNPADPTDFGDAYPTGSGNFAGSETVKTILILVAGDANEEPNEGFTVTVSAPGLASVSSTGTINDDDKVVPVPAFAFSGPALIVEGTPPAIVPAFAFSGPAAIAEGTPPPAQYGFAGPATINEG
ncbi:hypothetical protein [Sphingomonas abaci]|uniref:Calx-beta domain-containing protein n=1 Tax=Sphingomonas abaci TaxID=237611 RepID=A0A7W7F080_9SPHN|nr:hypothetical protein [Sphingomonas abaci]MBB4619981.1 hypothetical protein [Sphingomonas abaci]